MDRVMRRVLLGAMVVVVLSGCWNAGAYGEIPPLDPSVDTIEEILGVVTERVTYAWDWENEIRLDSWQQPWETWALRTGDCEDYAILAAYLAARIGIEVKIESGFGRWHDQYGGHVWISVDGRHYEATSGVMNPALPEQFDDARMTMTLERAMNIARLHSEVEA
jgi:transglutaminase-like putative cysteine protease